MKRHSGPQLIDRVRRQSEVSPCLTASEKRCKRIPDMSPPEDALSDRVVIIAGKRRLA